MLLSKILENKKYFTKPNGDIIVDMTKSSIKFNDYVDYKSIVIVTDDFVMRPDLVSLAKMNDINKFDYILKYNGISNPFSLYEGQVLLIPDMIAFTAQIKSPDDEIKENDDSKNAAIAEKYNKTPNAPLDINRIKYLNNLEKMKKRINTPPNVNDSDKPNVSIDDDNITFGDVISESGEKCDNYSTKAKIKESLLSNKLNNFIKIKDIDVNENKQII